MIRYLLLVALNLPVLLVAMVTTIAAYKMGRMALRRYIVRVVFWSVAIIGVVAGFPIYNAVNGLAVFEIHDVSLLEIVLVTAVIYLLLIANLYAQKIENLEKMVRNMHSTISIKMSEGQYVAENKKTKR